jgi:hypothetical protein
MLICINSELRSNIAIPKKPFNESIWHLFSVGQRAYS